MTRALRLFVIAYKVKCKCLLRRLYDIQSGSSLVYSSTNNDNKIVNQQMLYFKTRGHPYSIMTYNLPHVEVFIST